MTNVTRRDLAKIIGDKTIDIKDSKRLSRAIAGYLVDNGRHGLIDLESLMRDVMQYRFENGYIEVTAVSAHELNDMAIDDIKSLIRDHFPKAKGIIVNTRIDNSLVGGVRLDFPMESLDLSIRSKLNTLRELVAKERN